SRKVAGRLAWVAPALALALALQATFGFASHSVARAAVEVGSATVRGSLSASPLIRGRDFVSYFALASLPVVALAPFGLAAALRGLIGRRSWRDGSGRDGGDRSLLLVAWPSLLYLTLVTALVVAGVYSGSHRYYYPALPGLVLAAAAAADRLRMPAALVPVGAAVVVAGAFLPGLDGLGREQPRPAECRRQRSRTPRRALDRLSHGRLPEPQAAGRDLRLACPAGRRERCRGLARIPRGRRAGTGGHRLLPRARRAARPDARSGHGSVHRGGDGS